MKYLGSFSRDSNFSVDTSSGCLSTNSKILTGNNATVAIPLFTVAGAVEIKGVWAVITTVLGTNHTASAFRLNDSSVQSDITLSTGTDISAAPVGSIIAKKGLAAAALTLIKSDQERVSEPTTLETTFFSPFVVNAKNAVTTNIEYVYATTDAPTTGALQFFVRWLPLSVGAQITAL